MKYQFLSSRGLHFTPLIEAEKKRIGRTPQARALVLLLTGLLAGGAMAAESPGAATNSLGDAKAPGPTNLPAAAAAKPEHTTPAAAPAVDLSAEARLESAGRLRQNQQFREAEALLVDLLGDASPENVRKKALLELAEAAKGQDQLPRALEIYSQYLNRWPGDPMGPEVLLRQGRVFREIGMNNLAFAKFYAVMTSALVVSKENLDVYQKLVLQAQIEIAETHFGLGRFAQAAEFYTRLLKQNSPELDRPLAQFRLIRALAACGQHEELATQAQDYLNRYTQGAEQPEVRFHLAVALRASGRNSDALQQVLLLLHEQGSRTNRADLLAYWQKRAGNEVANQLYQAGDHPRALAIYQALAALENSADWQLPVIYQIGLTCERLDQPQMALEQYQQIIRREPDLGTNAPLGLKTLVEMARWRAGFVKWQQGKSLPLPAVENTVAGGG